MCCISWLSAGSPSRVLLMWDTRTEGHSCGRAFPFIGYHLILSKKEVKKGKEGNGKGKGKISTYFKNKFTEIFTTKKSLQN